MTFDSDQENFKFAFNEAQTYEVSDLTKGYEVKKGNVFYFVKSPTGLIKEVIGSKVKANESILKNIVDIMERISKLENDALEGKAVLVEELARI
jgi:hypothetical protein